MSAATDINTFPAVYAEAYNQFAGQQASRVMAACEALLFPGLPAGAHLLDLGCGTGQVAQELLARGFAVTGLDLGVDMLAHAAVNAPRGRFLAADMRTFALPPVHDACLAIQCLALLGSVDDLAATFANVHRALRPGGSVLFEVHLPSDYGKDRLFTHVGDDLVLVERESYPERGAYIDTTATLFYRGGDGWQRWDGRWREINYSAEDFRAALTAAGFAEPTFHEGARDLGRPELAERTYVVARRTDRRDERHACA
jgi:SAM-dependent methyltransferase